MARDKIQRPSDAATDMPRATLSVAELRQLITLMNGSDIEEIGIEEPGSGLRLSLRKPAPVAMPISGSEDEPLDYASTDGATPAPSSTTIEVTAPLVGLFRVSMKADERPLCALGDVVREGQIVCAIESLNLLNEVEAPAAGRITAIYLSDGQPVEYGRPLLAIEPQG